MPRFVVLEHDWPTRHWDLLLEDAGVLKAWRLLCEPTGDGRSEPNADHRLMYLDYEGPLSGGRGAVTRWDSGTFEWVERGDGRAVVAFSGAKLIGRRTMADGWFS